MQYHHHSVHMVPPQGLCCGAAAPGAYSTSPLHSAIPLSAPTPPWSPAMDEALSTAESVPGISADGIYHSRHSSPPVSSPGGDLVHYRPLCDPTPSPTNLSDSRCGYSTHEDANRNLKGGVAITKSLAKKEAARRQKVESSRRRRDELRNGYTRLKDILPISNQRDTKISTLERGTSAVLQHFLHLCSQTSGQ